MRAACAQCHAFNGASDASGALGFRAALTVAAGLAAVGILAALVRGDEGRSNHAALQISSSPGPSEEP